MKNYYALRPLTYNGKQYEKGDKLEHKTGIRDHQILKTMVRMRKISVTAAEIEPEFNPAIAPPIVPLVPVTTAPPPPPVATLVVGGPELKHTGAGWYNIELNGTV